MNYDKFLMIFKKYIEPFIALGVLILLIVLCLQIYDGNELREEISQNCGWGEEDYRCFCEKSEAMAVKNKMDNVFGEVNYVPLAG